MNLHDLPNPNALRERTIAQLADCLFLAGNTVKSLGQRGICMIASHQFASGALMTPDELETALTIKEAAVKAAIDAQGIGEGK